MQRPSPPPRGAERPGEVGVRRASVVRIRAYTTALTAVAPTCHERQVEKLPNINCIDLSSPVAHASACGFSHPTSPPPEGAERSDASAPWPRQGFRFADL